MKIETIEHPAAAGAAPSTAPAIPAAAAPSGSFSGLNAFVLGATGGIGSAITQALLDRGARVLGTGRTDSSILELRNRLPHSDRFDGFPCDLSRPADISTLRDAKAEFFDAIDILVISSGTMRSGSTMEADLDHFDEHFSVNVRGPYALIQAALPSLIARRGQLVMISSSAGLKGRPRIGQYSATQAALKALADSVRDEVNEHLVRVMTVFPGRTAGPKQESLYQENGQDYVPELLLQPEDLARMVVAALDLPRTAEVTELHIRPLVKSY